MARTKRKAILFAAETPSASVKEQKKYKAAGYARLSVEDSGKPGAETIETQKTMVTEFIEKASDMEFVSLFQDNGMTGTDFKRPGFEQLMDAVRAGKVNCIVVKDLSRFGRNYKETGNYLERIFPFLGVRFVAITDGFDTLTAERGPNGFIIPLKNLINETYSRDISKKISDALHTKQERGEYVGSHAPYGYSKDPEDPHKLVPNPETAPIVHRIFGLRFNGISYRMIARILNDEGIASPAKYLSQTGLSDKKGYADSIWNARTIRDIVHRQTYIGDSVHGIRYQSFHDGIPPTVRPKEEWTIVENTHEPIVNEGVFWAVQKMDQAMVKAYHESLGKKDSFEKTDNIFRGMVYCADCGRALNRVRVISRRKTPKPPYYKFLCPSHSSDPKLCAIKNIHEAELISILRETISKQIALAVDMRDLASSICSASLKNKKAVSLRDQLAQAQKSLNRCESLREGLYQNYVEHLITEAEYTSMKKRYISDEEMHTKRIQEIEKQIAEAEKIGPRNRFLTAFTMIPSDFEISRDTLTALIDRIEIGTNNRVEIRFKFRDELEELDQHLKREARPDEYRSKVSSHFK